MRTALIDGDVLVYAAGFAAVDRSYIVNEKAFRYKVDAVSYCKENGFNIEDITREDEPQPLDFCLANVKRIINKILETTEADEYKVFLSGDDSYRKDIDSSYKANRDPTHKPFYYQEIRDYLTEHHDAHITTSGIEADDAMGMACQEEDIICTVDKDLDTVAGWHYNWKKDELYYVTSDEADLFFWQQMLMGDQADNIPGIPGIGPKTATKLLEGVHKDRRACVVGMMYALSFDDPETAYTNNANLLWILR